MKYRRLTQEELKDLQPDFIAFLSSNTITGTDWEKIKKDTPGKAEQLIDMFSDIVLEKVLQKVDYLEYKTVNDIKTFHFLEDKILMNGLFVEGDIQFDFQQERDPEQMMTELKSSGAKLKLYTAEKKYVIGKEQEAFKMLENGALISKDGALFKLLEGLKGR